MCLCKNLQATTEYRLRVKEYVSISFNTRNKQKKQMRNINNTNRARGLNFFLWLR